MSAFCQFGNSVYTRQIPVSFDDCKPDRIIVTSYQPAFK